MCHSYMLATYALFVTFLCPFFSPSAFILKQQARFVMFSLCVCEASIYFIKSEI